MGGRWSLLAAFLFLAGCVDSGDRADTLDEGVGQDAAAHMPLDAFFDIAYDGTYMQRSVEHLGGAYTGQNLHFHTWDEVVAKLAEWNATYPGFVELSTIGTTRLGREIPQIVLTDESLPPETKLAPLLDGAHHGNEYAGGEVMLYTVAYILENQDNATVRQWLRDLEIHVVPVVNPDGWVANTRYNGFGVNLNRNYDLDWGNPAGTSNPYMGQVGAASGQALGGVALVAENCGAEAFSEPESRAIRDLMASLDARAAFYISGHTPSHAVIAPWAAFEAPAAMPPQHAEVLDAELGWIRGNTEYEAGKAAWGDFSAGLPYAASGSSMDWFYATHQRPAFTIEVEFFYLSETSDDFPQRLADDYDGLRYWMDATVPITLHALANAQQLAAWEMPTNDAPLPPDFVLPELPDRQPEEFPYLH